MKNNKIYNLVLVLFFSLLFIFGVSFINKVGCNFDEWTEQNILRMNIMQYAKFFKIDGLVEYYEEADLVPISMDKDRDHGVAPYYFYAPLLLLEKISTDYLTFSWHLYTYILFFIGVIYIYKLVQYLFKNEIVSFITTLLYFLSPRILFDSLHNNKDIVLMSLLIVMIYYGFKFVFESDKKSMILFAISSAFVCNIKIIGVYFTGVIGLGYIVKLFVDKNFNKKTFSYGLLTACLVFVLFIIITPAILGRPGSLKLVKYFYYCLKNSVDFRATTYVLFEGFHYNKAFVPLPRYYIPKLIFMTTPIINTVLFLIGTFLIIKDSIKMLKKKKFNKTTYSFIMIYAIFILPLLVAIITKPNLYNGWRHFYFLWGSICVISSYAIKYLIENKNKIIKYGLAISLCLTFVYNIYMIFKYDIRNVSYYNLLWLNNLDDKYELDYYGTTGRDSMKRLLELDNLKTDEDGKINMWGNSFSGRIIKKAYDANSRYFKDKVNILNDEEYERALENGEYVYVFYNRGHSGEELDEEVVYDYTMGNNSISKFYLVKGN